ncbi:sensor histidine kinase [Lentzea aerocolonigenes]|uniref:sensor histidine kinase n=1 Tax=Lentzea aerocolonigenes TaxID=68170 RepID=UPI00069774A1|nr:ATP-binding protein [Lentzea aerocolonigenes]
MTEHPEYRTAAWTRLGVLVPMSASLLVSESVHKGTLAVILLGYAAWNVGWFRWARRPSVPQVRRVLVPITVDLVAITALSWFSGGPDAEVSYAYFLLPVAAIPLYRAGVTLAVGAIATGAYGLLAAFPLAQADFDDLDPHRGAAYDLVRVLTYSGYLLWFAAVCAALTAALRRRGMRIADLLDQREQLLSDAVSAEERERAALADSLHDSAIQNLLAAKLELEDLPPGESRERVERLLGTTLRELREAVFELHPRILAELGLAAALKGLGDRIAARSALRISYDLSEIGRHEHEALLYSAGRELLRNVARHSGAEHVSVHLFQQEGRLWLQVLDDGVGVRHDHLLHKLAEGHVGLASHRVRVEGAGGELHLRSRRDGGTEASVVLPIG